MFVMQFHLTPKCCDEQKLKFRKNKEQYMVCLILLFYIDLL